MKEVHNVQAKHKVPNESSARHVIKAGPRPYASMTGKVTPEIHAGKKITFAV